jgi:hypothetical protein
MAVSLLSGTGATVAWEAVASSNVPVPRINPKAAVRRERVLI